MDNPVQKWLLIVLEQILGVRDTTPSCCVMRECGLGWAPTVQLVSCHHASLQLSDPMQQHHCQHQSFTCWHATELQVWWLLVFPIFFSAMTGLVQEYMFKEKLRNCEFIDLSCFVVDLRDRHLEFWTLYFDGSPREHNSKFLTYSRWCALPPKKALAPRSPYSLALPNLFSLTSHSRCHSQCCPFQTACPHPLLWDRNMEPQVLPCLSSVWGWWWCPGWTACYSTAHTPIQCLFAGDMSPYPYKHEHRMFLPPVCARTTANSNFSCINWLFFMSRLAVARFDWRPFPCTL